MNNNTENIQYDNKVAIGIVTYNARNYLPFCLNSIQEQTFKDYQILIIDNGSSDDTIAYLNEKFPHYKVVSHKENLGFSQAFNQIISWTKSEYVFCVNQDTVLAKDYIAKAVEFLDQHQDAGGVSGKLLRWIFQDDVKTKIIDSVGQQIFKNHKVTDKGAGEVDTGQYDKVEEVFGISGALPIYRRNALDSVALKNKHGKYEYFDENYFSYKEDVDLAWRMRLVDWKLYCVPQALAYHDRSIASTDMQTDWQIATAHRKKNKLINFLSYRNHLLTIYKNEFRVNLWGTFFQTLPYEIKKFMFMKLFNRINNKKFRNFRQLLPLMKHKRIQVQKMTKIRAKEISKWYQ